MSTWSSQADPEAYSSLMIYNLRSLRRWIVARAPQKEIAKLHLVFLKCAIKFPKRRLSNRVEEGKKKKKRKVFEPAWHQLLLGALCTGLVSPFSFASPLSAVWLTLEWSIQPVFISMGNYTNALGFGVIVQFVCSDGSGIVTFLNLIIWWWPWRSAAWNVVALYSSSRGNSRCALNCKKDLHNI